MKKLLIALVAIACIGTATAQSKSQESQPKGENRKGEQDEQIVVYRDF